MMICGCVFDCLYCDGVKSVMDDLCRTMERFMAEDQDSMEWC